MTKLIKNSGNDRVIDELRRRLVPQGTLDIATPAFSLFAFGELQEPLTQLARCRLVIPDIAASDLALFGTEADRAYRNRLQTRRLMQQCIAWLEAKTEVRKVPGKIPQAAFMVRDRAATFIRVITGHCPFTTEGLGITPGPPFSLIQAAESTEECALLGGWFASLWQSLPASPESKQVLLARLRELTRHPAPSLIYFLMLYQVFKDLGDELDEERIVKSATGIEIRRLNLAAYAPLRYVLPPKQRAYNEKYSTRIRGSEKIFRQLDREESLVHLLRVNLLKRMESSVVSFALTLQRQLADVNATLAKIETHADAVEEINIEDVDMDDPNFESLLVGRKVKVLLQDVDRVRWRQDLIEDRNRLATLLSAAKHIDPARDAKLAALREVIERKCRQPINPGNRKLIIFTAFADTAQYLYQQVAPWVLQNLGLHTALVTGAGRNQTTLPTLRKDLASLLTAFSPRSKERPVEFADEGELDLLIATDCISEGQNLQDCDALTNYDIHWNPVRIIQWFGRIDRIGSTNACIQLINFWPNRQRKAPGWLS